jgi:hypothetical protein
VAEAVAALAALPLPPQLTRQIQASLRGNGPCAVRGLGRHEIRKGNFRGNGFNPGFIDFFFRWSRSTKSLT